MICLFKSLHPYHLLIQQDKPLPDDPVVMVMPEEPVSEPAPLPDLLQKLCEGIRGGPARSSSFWMLVGAQWVTM